MAYGFFPQRHQTLYETWPMMHAADERIDVRDLGFAAAFFHDLPGRLLVMPVPEDKLRLGGMALRNGLLVHGPTHWAAAVRTARRRRQGRRPAPSRASPPTDKVPGLRGLARLAEAFAVIPLVKPRPAGGAAAVRERRPCSAWRPARRSAGTAAAPARAARAAEAAAALIALAPALFALRGGELAAYHGVEHKAIAAYEADDDDAADATKEHERCGSHLVAPMLAANLAGTLLLKRALERPSPLAGGAVALASTAAAVEVFALDRAPRRLADGPRAQAPGLRDPAPVGTREPDERQLEVGRAALAEILRVESEVELRVQTP